LIVFGLVFKTAVRYAKNASGWIFFILVAICLSNFLSTLMSYTVGTFVYQLDLLLNLPKDELSLQPLWNLQLPTFIQNDWAMFAGLLLGALLGRFAEPLAIGITARLDRPIHVLLGGILVVIPLFVAGFVVKMNHDKMMNNILVNYSQIFIMVAGAVFTYIFFIYSLIHRFRLRETAQSVKNMLPATLAGFCSMSSLAAMPLTIIGVEKNSKRKDVAASIIPISVNIHLIGDCFAIPIFAFAVLKSYGVSEPGLMNYLIFASYFVLAKFSIAAVPGGGILVMLPILEKYLGFNGEMLSLITALYILFDPVITSANVLGNGGFSVGLDKLELYTHSSA
jgi:Na+/H+-dicarboxylate symporter